jgi:hypothetical protein
MNNTISHYNYPQSAGGTRKRYQLSKSKNDIVNVNDNTNGSHNGSRYNSKNNGNNNDRETFMTSKSSRRTSIGHYKLE